MPRQATRQLRQAEARRPSGLDDATPDTPIEVELPVCDVCGNASKAAASTQYGGKWFCDGPAGQMHRRTQMHTRRFREVVT